MQTETIAVLTAGTKTDPYSGETTADWSTPTEASVTTLAPLEPRPSSEPVQDARNAVVSGFTAYLPSGTAVTAQNRVRARGKVYQVLGEPADWTVGIVIQLGLTEG